MDYCAEGDINSPDLEATIESNADLFEKSAWFISRHKNEMISIKITGLLDMRVLKTWNQAVTAKDDFWKANQHSNPRTTQTTSSHSTP